MNEVSIWVDQFRGAVIGHGSFVHTLCSEKSQMKSIAKLIRWKKPGNSYFDKEDLPLSCCNVKTVDNVLHLFSLGEAAWRAFHKSHMLDELKFQPDLGGMIVVLDRESVLLGLKDVSLEDKRKIISEHAGIHFSWFEKQRLPFVIAAAGYEGAQSELEQLRATLDLTQDIPMIPGPSLFQGDSLSFDRAHADRVLTVLGNLINSSKL